MPTASHPRLHSRDVDNRILRRHIVQIRAVTELLRLAQQINLVSRGHHGLESEGHSLHKQLLPQKIRRDRCEVGIHGYRKKAQLLLGETQRVGCIEKVCFG